MKRLDPQLFQEAEDLKRFRSVTLVSVQGETDETWMKLSSGRQDACRLTT